MAFTGEDMNLVLLRCITVDIYTQNNMQKVEKEYYMNLNEMYTIHNKQRAHRWMNVHLVGLFCSHEHNKSQWPESSTLQFEQMWKQIKYKNAASVWRHIRSNMSNKQQQKMRRLPPPVHFFCIWCFLLSLCRIYFLNIYCPLVAAVFWIFLTVYRSAYVFIN